MKKDLILELYRPLPIAKNKKVIRLIKGKLDRELMIKIVASR